MKEEKIIIENEGQKIVGIMHKSDKPSDKIVILVHGFTGDMDGPAGFWIPIAKELCKNGFDVFRFNFRFTTKDWSLFQNMTIKGEVSDLRKIISVMSKRYKKIGILGESMGGTVSILSYSDKVEVMVLWYPNSFLRENLQILSVSSLLAIFSLKMKGYVILKKHGEEIKIGKNFIDEIRTLDLIPFIKKIKCPVLIIHGNKDTTVSIKQSKKLIELLKGSKKLEVIEGAKHEWRGIDHKLPVPEFQDKALSLTSDWFKKWLK